MDVFALLGLIGGLALFLYGMTVMGEGLVSLSGGQLERILEKLTANRIMALLLGALVTAIIQSSSATTVMVIGFVNSGVMELQQAVGVIMGANVGTTITSWILSLTGIEGDNIFIRLLKPSSFAPVLAGIGVILTMMKPKTNNQNKRKNIGSILLGFAILMTGMENMSSSVSSLADNPNFTGILTTFSTPIWGILAGLALTVAIQSSSASIGILQALCVSGAVTYGVAIPIILGQNIGTCVTALLSSIGANKNARRASLIHLYFNLLGTFLFITVFYLFNYFFQFDFLTKSANVAGIAVFHTTFNIGSALVLLPFANSLVKLAVLSIPQSLTTDTARTLPPSLSALDSRFLNQPGYAIGLCKNAVKEMATLSQEALRLAILNLKSYSTSNVEKVLELEKQTDVYEDVIGTYLIKLTGRSLSRVESRKQSIFLHTINDLERIADHAAKVAEKTAQMHSKQIVFTLTAQKELEVYSNAIHEILDYTVKIFQTDLILGSNGINLAKKIEPLEEIIDELYREMKNRHINRLLCGDCSKEAGLFLVDLIGNLERLSDHCSKIAVCLLEIESDSYEMHEHKEHEIDEQFRRDLDTFRNSFTLPEVTN